MSGTAPPAGSIPDRGRLHDRGPEPAQPRGEHARRARARVTPTLTPASGAASSHSSCGPSAATSPTIVIAGRAHLGLLRNLRDRADAPCTARWSASVPRCTTVAGWSGERPPATSFSAIRSSRRTPTSKTSVPGKAASAGQSICVSGLDGILVPGDECDGCRESALGDRNPGIGGRGDAGADAGGTSAILGHAALRLFAAATEDERVAALTTLRPAHACCASRSSVSSCAPARRR